MHILNISVLHSILGDKSRVNSPFTCIIINEISYSLHYIFLSFKDWHQNCLWSTCMMFRESFLKRIIFIWTLFWNDNSLVLYFKRINELIRNLFKFNAFVACVSMTWVFVSVAMSKFCLGIRNQRSFYHGMQTHITQQRNQTPSHFLWFS